MRATGLLGLAGLCAMIAACDRGAQNDKSGANPVSAGNTASPEIDAYLKQLSVGDPEACFAEAELATASFQGPDAAAGTVPAARVIVAVDASGSMAGRVSGRTKLELAKTAAAAFVEELPADAQAGLLVFGQAGDNSDRGKARSCGSVDLVVPMTGDRGALVTSVGTIRPVGWTPLASALKRAETLLSASGRPGEQVIYVVSDGQETCGGDPVAVARSINQGSSRAVVNIIGFAVPAGEAASLAAVAKAGGGRFMNAGTESEVDAAAARIREEGRKAANTLKLGGTTARNTLAASGAAAKAQLCTSGIIARERLALGSDLARKRIAGRDVSLEERAEKILAERHAALERRADTFVQANEHRLDRANDAVNQNAAMAR